MGRHSKQPDREEAGEGERVKRPRTLGPVPLLPMIGGVMALTAVISALSTRQISLNFAAPPAPPQQLSTQSAGPLARSGHQARRDSVGPIGSGTVTVTFTRLSTLPGGFEGQATITNRSTKAVRGWTLEARYDDTEILDVADVIVLRKGATLIVRNPSGRPSIAPGAQVQVPFTAQGSAVVPSSCTFNGEPCRP